MNLRRMQVKSMLYIYIGFKQAVSKKITRQQHGLNALFSEFIPRKSIFFRIHSNKNAILIIMHLQGQDKQFPDDLERACQSFSNYNSESLTNS